MIFIQSVAKLDFTDSPAYEDYRNLFRELLARHHVENDQLYDWMISSKSRSKYIQSINAKFR